MEAYDMGHGYSDDEMSGAKKEALEELIKRMYHLMMDEGVREGEGISEEEEQALGEMLPPGMPTPEVEEELPPDEDAGEMAPGPKEGDEESDDGEDSGGISDIVKDFMKGNNKPMASRKSMSVTIAKGPKADKKKGNPGYHGKKKKGKSRKSY